MWQPLSGNLWSAGNIGKVWSRGTEVNATFQYKVRNFSFRIQSALSMLQSTQEVSRNKYDSSAGKQLVYIPRITQQHRLYLSFKNYYFSYLQLYTGLRFTTSDNSEFLNDYSLANMKAGYSIKWNKIIMLLSAEINNAWNVSYQVIRDRAMPGRNFGFGITIKI